MNQLTPGNLVQCLSALREAYEELLTVVNGKLAATKKADVEAINSCAAREQFLVERVTQVENVRRKILTQLQQQLGMDASNPTTISALAEHVDEPDRSRLLVLAAALRRLIEEVNRVNEVAALVTHELSKHLKHVFDVMAAPAMDGAVYGPRGGRQAARTQNFLDAVG